MPWLSKGNWLCAVFISGTLIAVGSAALQRVEISPIVLLSLLCGAVLGFVAVFAASVLDIRSRWLLLLGTLAAGIFLTVGQHYFLHRFAVRDWQQAQAKEPQLALFRPPPPNDLQDYLRQESKGRLAYWLLDGAIITATAVGIAVGLRKRIPEVNIEES